MSTKQLLPFLALVLLFIACSQDTKHKENEEHDHEHHEKHSEDNKHNHEHSANEHMHQSSVEDLIKLFESPERDTYQQPEKVLEYLGNLQNKRVMDIGAGSGYFSVKLAEKGAKVIAADVGEEFQSALQERITDNDLENIELRKIPVDSPSLADSEVDLVLIVNTYHHIKNRSEYFSKVLKGTKENGELVLIDFFKIEVPIGPPVEHKIAIDQVIAELKEAGYEKFDVNVDLLPYQYIIKAK